jgi:hypothetical protein
VPGIRPDAWEVLRPSPTLRELEVTEWTSTEGDLATQDRGNSQLGRG